MGTLSTTAWVLHDLGLAAGFGGNLFGQLALNPALKAIQSKKQRGQVSHIAWDSFKFVNIGALAAMAGTWLIGRTVLSGWEVGRESRNLTLLKDALVTGAVVTGAGAVVTGFMLDAELKQGQSIKSGGEPSADTPPRTARLQRLVNTFGSVNIALQASVLAVTAMLALKAGRSHRWAFTSRWLP